MDFLFALIELLSLGVTAEALRASTDWKSVFLKGSVRPNFHVVADISRELLLQR